jgi:prohibitin 1
MAETRVVSKALHPPDSTTRFTIDQEDHKMAAPNALLKWVVPPVLGAMFVQSSIYDVKGGTRAVIFDRLSGVQEKVIGEGTHFLIPWLQKSIIYDVRTKPRNISTTTGSKDMQMVSLTLRVLHRPDVPRLPQIYQVRSCTLIHMEMRRC